MINLPRYCKVLESLTLLLNALSEPGVKELLTNDCNQSEAFKEDVILIRAHLTKVIADSEDI